MYSAIILSIFFYVVSNFVTRQAVVPIPIHQLVEVLNAF